MHAWVRNVLVNNQNKGDLISWSVLVSAMRSDL